MIIQPGKADQVWLQLIDKINRYGNLYSPRGQETYEIIGQQTIVDMRHPIVTIPERKIGHRFMAAEAAWILSGDDRVSTISPYSRNISQFSDDGETFFGAYGPKIKDQLFYIANTLSADPDSRQAVINIWRENPGVTKDVPCSLSVQFLIRDNRLHCQYTMRSSDAWLGWVYDVFNFTMLSAVVLLMLGDRFPQLELWSLTLTAGSQHLYERDREGISRVLCGTMVPEPYVQFNPRAQFKDAEDLIKTLWYAADTIGALKLAQQGWAVK